MAAGRNSVLQRRESFEDGSVKEFGHRRDGYSAVKVDGSRNHHFTNKNGVIEISGSGRNGLYDGREERERGKFDDEHGVYRFQAGDGEIEDMDVALPPPEKKRKFSPIVWDLTEKEVRATSKNCVTQIAALSPTHPYPSSSLEASVTLPGDVLRAKSSLNSSYVPPQEHLGNHNQDVDEENNVQGWNITMSRWACNDLSPRDASDEFMKRKVSSSTETSELLRESLEGGTTSSSGSSGRDHYLDASIADADPEKEFLIDCMDDDVADQSEISCVSHSSSDSEEKGGSVQVQRNINMLQSCRSVFEFEMIKKINQGTYGIVYKARDKKTGEIVALKKMKRNIERDGDGFPMSALREINILLSFDHPSIVSVKEVVVDDFDDIFMVMEYMEYDMKGLMGVKKQPFSLGEIKSLMLQLLEGVKYLHDNWILHRDLKTSNILLNKEGELKICDFGLSRQYGSPLKPYTPVVVTLWYRAPELLLGAKEYSTAIDMWSVGCIMAELVAKEPLFNGEDEVKQLTKIFQIMGTPDENIWPGLSKLPGSKAKFVKQPYNMLRKKFPATSFTSWPVLSELGFDLFKKLLTYDPEKRITAEAALHHDWFCEAPLPKADFKPIFPSCHS